MNDLRPSVRRPLPPDVRDRMRATVLGGIRTPRHTTTHRARPPLAVAAGVAVLALGATIITQSLAGPHTSRATHESTAPGTPPSMNLAAANADMDRCWTAVERASKDGGVPARSTWQPVFAVPESGGLTVTAVRAGGKPLICETTRTTVTVSNPNASPAYAPGTRTGVLLNSADGVVAGVTDPDWAAMQFVATDKSNSMANVGSGFYQDGMFVDVGGFAPGGRYTVRQADSGQPATATSSAQDSASVESPMPLPQEGYPELTLPAAPAALVATVDRPDPPTDRTSTAGQFLGECIAKSGQAVLDPDSWQPLALAGAAPKIVVLARSGNRMATCVSGEAGRFEPNNFNEVTFGYDFMPAPSPLAANEPIEYSAGTSFQNEPDHASQTLIFAGVVRPDVTTLTIVEPGGAQRSVAVVNGIFTAEFADVNWQDIVKFVAVAQDVNGRQLYSGPIEIKY
jgi:hypothetical protein